jgi:hypothetical protein
MNKQQLIGPLTRDDFNKQVRELFDQHGIEAFAAPAGQLPARSLFVDNGEIVAEPADSPRHRYGAYCEMPAGNLMDVATQVEKWLNSGEAYDLYLSMNVCRYNC